jgi:uncharacterized protein YggE
VIRSLSIALVLLGATAAAAQDAERRAQPVVVAQGEGIVRATPDRAFVTVAAEARARSPKDAQRQNAEAMTAVRGKLKEANVADDAIRTLSVDLQPEFDYAEGRQRLRGYVARNAIEIRLDEVDRVGDVMDLVVTAGATSIRSVHFDLKDRDSAERQALRRAAADARARAEAAAAGAGRQVGEVVRLQEEGTFRPEPPRPMMMAEMRAEAAQQTPVSPGELEIRARVTITMALQ